MRGRPVVVAIDDDPDILRMLRELLDGEGYRVVALSAPPADPADLATHLPALILTDLVFPVGIGGEALLRALAAHPATAGVPVVVCSADRRLLRGLAAELPALACAVVEKPFDIEDLLAAVAACLEQGRDARAG